jgi:stalled ribosome rescue protein Dom34
MEQCEPKDTVTPNVDEEVGENVKPKVVREVVFKMFAVKKESVKTFITKKLKENASGDKTQTIYSAGENEAFFEKFQNTTDESTARLKTSVITGPKVTEQMVADKSLGKKVGEVKHLLQSINGVSSVSVNPNYFWVTSVPSDPNKVQIKVTVEQ